MTATSVRRALQRGMRLIAECRVDRLILRRGRVQSVRATARDYDGRRHSVTVIPRAVFICAGAIHTPALLCRSGLRHNIGRALRMHPTIKVTARFERTIDAATSRLPLYAITEFMPDQRIGGSYFRPSFFAMNLAEDWPQRAWLLPQWNQCGLYYAMARATATGKIRPILGCEEPIVVYNPTRVDWHNLATGLTRLGRAMFAAGATHVYPSVTGHPGWTNAKQCDEFLHRDLPADRTNLMTIHLFSSCPPGEDVTLCATNSFGVVNGTHNLIIADASQIPEAPGVNPQLTVMALALRAADSYLDSSRTAATQKAG